MSEEIGDLSADDRRRIEKTASRNIKAECTLIMTAGFSVIMIVTFALNKWTFLPIAVATGLRPIAVWVLLSFAAAALWAAAHLIWFRPKILRARSISAQMLYQYKDAQRREREARYRPKP